MQAGCPGSSNIKGTPSLRLKECPTCGTELELFSSDMTTKCPKCGFVAYNDTQTCIMWCAYAKECVGEELYEQFHEMMRRNKENNQADPAPPVDPAE